MDIACYSALLTMPRPSAVRWNRLFEVLVEMGVPENLSPKSVHGRCLAGEGGRSRLSALQARERSSPGHIALAKVHQSFTKVIQPIIIPIHNAEGFGWMCRWHHSGKTEH